MPVNLAELFSRTGGLVFRERAPVRQAYRQVELARWSKALDIPINLEPRYYPVCHEPASRLILAAAQLGEDVSTITGMVLAAVWRDDRNIADLETLREIAAEISDCPDKLMSLAGTETIGGFFAELTDEVVAKGAFGAPTYCLNGELFWGQDRLQFLEEAILRA